jgi:hypothetical protein
MIDPWDAFCDALRDAGKVIQRDTLPKDERTRAEGYRYLARMIRAGLENTHEFANTDRPVLAPMVGPHFLSEGAGSDARYLHAFIDGSKTYRINGSRGPAPLIEVGVYNGKIGLQAPSHLVRSLTEEELTVAEGGELEVILSPQPQEGNWIQTDASVRYLMIRQYAHDWSSLTPSLFTILAEQPGEVVPLSLEKISANLLETARFVREQPPFWANISDYWQANFVNCFQPQLQADSKTDIAPPSGHHFSCGYFRLEPDQALQVNFHPSEVPFWGFELTNYWYEVIGYSDTRTHLNNKTASYEEDGSVKLTISHSGIGRGNELLTLGHREGTMVFRWSRSDQPVPVIEATLANLSDLE